MNLEIVPRQIEKKNMENPLSRIWLKKRKGRKKCIPLPMQWHQNPRKKFRFPLLPKEKNYEINTVRIYSDYQ